MACDKEEMKCRFIDFAGFTLPEDTYIADVTSNALVIEYAGASFMEVEDHVELKLEISLDNKSWHSVGTVKPKEGDVLVELSAHQSLSITDNIQEQIAQKLTPLLAKISDPTDSKVTFDVSKLSVKNRLNIIKIEENERSTNTLQFR